MASNRQYLQTCTEFNCCGGGRCRKALNLFISPTERGHLSLDTQDESVAFFVPLREWVWMYVLMRVGVGACMRMCVHDHGEAHVMPQSHALLFLHIRSFIESRASEID